MKLVVCVIHNRDKGKIIDELIRAGFKFTIIGSTGGFLREGNSTFLIGVEEEALPLLKDLVCEHCASREQLVNVLPMEAAQGAFGSGPVKAPVGGAVMFVLNVEEYAHF